LSVAIFRKWAEYSEEMAMLYVAFFVFVVVTAGLAVLAFENLLKDVSLSLIFWNTPPLPVGLMLLLSFLLGAAVLFLVAAAAAMDDRRELKRLRWRVKELEGVMAKAAPAASPVFPMPGMPGSPPDISDMTTLH
jgi:uncharacterized integral membrane protein